LIYSARIIGDDGAPGQQRANGIAAHHSPPAPFMANVRLKSCGEAQFRRRKAWRKQALVQIPEAA